MYTLNDVFKGVSEREDLEKAVLGLKLSIILWKHKKDVSDESGSGENRCNCMLALPAYIPKTIGVSANLMNSIMISLMNTHKNLSLLL